MTTIDRRSLRRASMRAFCMIVVSVVMRLISCSV
jgi:hypothetical protein